VYFLLRQTSLTLFDLLYFWLFILKVINPRVSNLCYTYFSTHLSMELLILCYVCVRVVCVCVCVCVCIVVCVCVCVCVCVFTHSYWRQQARKRSQSPDPLRDMSIGHMSLTSSIIYVSRHTLSMCTCTVIVFVLVPCVCVRVQTWSVCS
jgi:hypothetical protein